MKVAIDARVKPGATGGVAPAVRSLLSALGKLTDGPEEYSILVDSQDQADWLSPLAGNQRFVWRPQPRRSRLKSAIRRVQHLVALPRFWPEVPISDGFYESLGCDVVHFPTQAFTVCAVPSVYNPHDLQHLHYPQFFSPWELAWRETVYRAGCHFAQTVIVNSQWIKEDVTRQYAVSPHKIQVVPEAPATQTAASPSADDLSVVREKYGLPADFALYPSVNWPHKNHLRLFDALAYLRDRRGLRVTLVCTGGRYEPFWPAIESRIAELGLASQVKFLGFVPHNDLRAMYRLSRCLVLPTLFEANSLPIFEAWLEGTPVACARVTALPEQLMDAGLLFDPFDHVAIADAVQRLYTDGPLRELLKTRGTRRLDDFDWARTARAYRAVYRRTAGQRLSPEDEELLNWDWMREPRARLEARA